MFDINFYRATAPFKTEIMNGRKMNKDWVEGYLEHQRSKKPYVYNIESTNACNMSCFFCSRTTLMTRPVLTMQPSVFENVVNQLKPHSEKEWNEWLKFIDSYYGVPKDEMSENNWFLYVIPKVIVLHGYGDPLLDPHIPDYIKLMTERNLPSYFSCNPANINVDKLEKTFANGLDYIKFSVDSLTTSVRGKDAFEHDYPLIMETLDMKKRGGYKTQIVITMINIGQAEFDSLREKFDGTDVYIYQKSLDQAFALGAEPPKSIHWREYCQFPWTSMTVKSDGIVASCSQDYNNDLVFGDTKTQTLKEIWNGEPYAEFRRQHVYNTPGIRCTTGGCDMTVIGAML